MFPHVRTLGRPLAPVLIAALLGGCWSVPTDDAGDRQFATWATVALLGRRPLNLHEVEVLADLAAEDGRRAVVDVLMAQPEFVTHWTRILMDRHSVAREGDERVDDVTCYTDKRLATHQYDDLVHHLRFQSWKTPFCPSGDHWVAPTSSLPAPPRPAITDFTAGDSASMREQFDRLAGIAPYERGVVEPRLDQAEYIGEGAQGGVPMRGLGFGTRPNNCESFTMADAYAAALTEDRMDALLRVGLVPLATTSNDTATATSRFLEVYVERDPGCVECHGTTYSTTDARPGNGEWDRFFPATFVDLEAGAFSYTDGSGYHDGSLGGSQVGRRVRNLFRGDGWRTSSGLYPFGIDGSCASEGDRRGFNTAVASDAGLPAAFSGLEGTNVGIGDLVDQFAIGVAAFGWDQLEPAPTPITGDVGDGATAYTAYCAGCHGGADPDAPNMATASRYMSTARIYDTIVNGSRAGLMPAGVFGVTDEEARDIAVYIASWPAHVDPQVYSTPAANFAHLSAMAFVNDVYETLAGESLVLSHYTPRNDDAAATLEHLTRSFVDSGWSLKTLLGEIVDSSLANRRAPAASAHGPYELPMLFQPWADIGPGTTQLGEDANGQGDVVHRWPVPTLLLQVQHALLWPEPPMFPASSTNTYADLPFQRSFGAPTGETQRGVDQVATAALLAWEREIGTCQNPTPDPDFVSVVTDAGADLTVEEAMLAVKERLLTDRRWWSDPYSSGGFVGPGGPQDERTLAGALAALSGVTLSDPASDPGGEDAVRDYCGALLMSPDFLLMGLPAWDGSTPPSPGSGVPCVDDACTYSDFCDRYADAAGTLGYSFDCEIDDITWGR